MIPVYSPTLDSPTKNAVPNTEVGWQKQMSQSIKSPADLLQHLNIDIDQLPYKVDLQNPFKTRVTHYFSDLIDPSNPNDPILLQVLPRLEETEHHLGYQDDPLDEQSFMKLPGLIHKYKNRVLLIAHQACALHCRYCFRRHFPYSEARLSDTALERIIQYIQQDTNINEIIFSGGDPLSLSDSALAEMLEQLATIDHVSTFRFHTRTPIVLPDRITTSLCQTFKASNKSIVMVLHSNHANELSSHLQQKLNHLKQAGVTLLNQTVLLKGINDSVNRQVDLANTLFSYGVLPYYLHHLDPVSGTHHFQVDAQTAKSLWQRMQTQLSGYLLPRLVQEIPHKSSKTWINPINIELN